MKASQFMCLSYGLLAFAACWSCRGYGVTVTPCGDVHADTRAIQRAVDAVSAAGGGEVFLGAGTYECGSIWLKDNVDFHLGAGAVLKGTADLSLYCASNCCPQNAASPRSGDNTSGGHLLLAVNADVMTDGGSVKRRKLTSEDLVRLNENIVTARKHYW